MRIKVNDTHEFEIEEQNLFVKDKKLYNSDTKQFEGVEGDIVEFIHNEDGRKVLLRGTVDKYTNSGVVKIRGREETYKTDPTKMKMEHLSVVEEI